MKKLQCLERSYLLGIHMGQFYLFLKANIIEIHFIINPVLLFLTGIGHIFNFSSLIFPVLPLTHEITHERGPWFKSSQRKTCSSVSLAGMSGYLIGSCSQNTVNPGGWVMY